MAFSQPAAKRRRTIQVQQQDETVDSSRPTSMAGLREARLSAMNTPAADRSKTRQELQRSKSDAGRTKSSRTEAAPTKTRRPSFSLFGHRSSAAPVRTKSTTKSRSDNYENVYASPSMISHKAKSEPATTTKPISDARHSDSVARTSSKKGPLRTASANAKVNQVPRESAAKTKPKKHERAVSESVVSKGTAKAPRTSLLGGLFSKSTPKAAPVPEKQVSCLICGADDIPLSKSARLPCTHRMCHACLRRIFKMSIKDPAHMPPRCCTEHHIDLKHVDKLFSEDFKKTWNRKFKEYTAKNRIYCPRKGCGEWIQPKHMRLEQGRKIGVCPTCHHAVCAICNQKAHRSRECPKDPTIQEFNEMAKSKGWIKCYNCSATVELKEGCNHMTCRCRAEFCMICGKKWKSCDCPWFNYAAAGNLNGDPIRYQEEMDRRRDQERRDEEMARAMAGLDVRRSHRRRSTRLDPVVPLEDNNGLDNGQNIVQRAREALTANYRNGEVPARGLLGDWLTAGGQRASPRESLHQDDTIRSPRSRTSHRSRRVHAT